MYIKNSIFIKEILYFYGGLIVNEKIIFEDEYKNETKIFLFILCFMELGRSLPHAVLTLIFLSKGISLSQVALIQIFFMLAVLLLEIPSGIIADLFSQKKVYLLSISLLLLSYFLIYFCNSIFFMCLAWFLYGAASAFSSGTLDVMFLSLYEKDSPERKKFLANMNIFSNLGGIVGGTIGGILYLLIGIKLYFIALIVFFICFIVTYFFIPNLQTHNNSKQKNLSEFIKEFVYVIKQVDTIQIFILFGILQFFYQPFFQYWQPFLLECNVNIKFLSFFYIIFRLISVLASKVFEHIKQTPKMNIFLLTFIFCISFGNYIYQNNVTMVLSLLIILFLVNLYSMNLSLFLRNSLNNETMGSVISANGTFTRLFSIVVLVFNFFIFRFFDVRAIMLLGAVLFVTLSFIFNVLFRYTNKISKI